MINKKIDKESLLFLVNLVDDDFYETINDYILSSSCPKDKVTKGELCNKKFTCSECWEDSIKKAHK